MVAATTHETKIGFAVSVGQKAGVEVRNGLVVVTVEHQQGTGRQPFGGLDGPDLTEFDLPPVTVGGVGRRSDHADLPGVAEEPVSSDQSLQ